MDSLYTPEIHDFVHSRDWPLTVKWIITEQQEPEPHLNIVFYRHNWLTLTFDEQLKTTAIVKEIMAKLWTDGIPTYTGKME